MKSGGQWNPVGNEIRLAMKVLLSHYSLRSCLELNKLFKVENLSWAKQSAGILLGMDLQFMLKKKIKNSKGLALFCYILLRKSELYFTGRTDGCVCKVLGW